MLWMETVIIYAENHINPVKNCIHKMQEHVMLKQVAE